MKSPINRARRYIIPFTEWTYARYVADPVHHLIGDAVDEVIRGEVDRLMIFAPPQHGKSEIVSVRLPALWLGKHPNDPVAITSYGASLARKKSRMARDVIQSIEYRQLFPDVKIRWDSRGTDNWNLAPPFRGEVWAGGVDGPITGSGFRLGIIDDPHKDWKEAQSQTQRDNVWDWYQNTFRTRLWEGSRIVLIMTRWHSNDLAGRLLEHEPGRWNVLRLPAIAEPYEVRANRNKKLGLDPEAPDPLGREEGEPLAPTRFSVEALADLKRDVSSRGWAAQYQGFPIPAEGNIFHREWFSEKIERPPGRLLYRIRYWDKAGTDDDGSYTVGVLMSTDGVFYYVEDVVRGQWSSGKREGIIYDTSVQDADRSLKDGTPYYIYHEQEPGSGGKDSARATQFRLREFNSFIQRAAANKEARADPLATAAEARRVILVDAPWNEDYIEELIEFNSGTYNDQVDASSGAYNQLHQRVNRRRKRSQKKQSYSRTAV